MLPANYALLSILSANLATFVSKIKSLKCLGCRRALQLLLSGILEALMTVNLSLHYTDFGSSRFGASEIYGV